jgi:hypothetical protein
MKRTPTGVSYKQAMDQFWVPDPSSPGLVAIAMGEDVRAKLEGQLPRDGAHLRDVILSVTKGFRTAP